MDLVGIWLHEQDWQASVTVAVQYIVINSISTLTYQWKWDALSIYTLMYSMQWPNQIKSLYSHYLIYIHY
jgi:hypothetical protein